MAKSRLLDKIKNKTQDLSKKPIWTGPDGSGPQGGISQSLIGRFLACRARFKVHMIDGYQGPDNFKPAMAYGNMWHLCEEAVLEGRNWRDDLKAHIVELATKYPNDREKISHWYSLCEEQYPIYLDYWQEEGEIVGREPLLREQNFDVPYTLPSGRIVRLRGKWDGLDLVKNPDRDGFDKMYLYENKTKSQIDADKLKKQLNFDLQTMFYIVAFKAHCQKIGGFTHARLHPANAPKYLTGVLYNVVKRSAHKSSASMVKKIQEDIEDNRVGEWFGRWQVEISQQEIDTFKKEFLDPILTLICIWYDHQTGKSWTQWHQDAVLTSLHWRHPNGLYNEVDENGGSIVDQYLNNGSTLGLVKIKTLFPELDGV